MWKAKVGQGGECTNGCLLDFPYFKENYKLKAIDLSWVISKYLMRI